MTLELVTSASTTETVYEAKDVFPAIGNGNLYKYISTHTPSGFYVCGGSDCLPVDINPMSTNNTSICQTVMISLLQDMYSESGLSGLTNGLSTFNNNVPKDAFTSNWLHYTTKITDPIVLGLIANKKIKVSLKVNHTCDDICVLLDNIVLDKECVRTERTDIFVTKSPGFELDRIRDNKKSWKANNTLENRDFRIYNNSGSDSIRQTNYDVNDDRLILNSKEIDLDINLASAIETDVWQYILNNSCLLTGETLCSPCEYKQFQDDLFFEFMDGRSYDFMDEINHSGNEPSNCCGDNLIEFDKLMTQPISAITVVEDFEYFLTSELIDAKNRQTISSYPTLRALYDRYLNSYVYCGNDSSAFDYVTMDQFAGLLGNYWVDIVEQVIPSTTIWGSIKVYSNTIFDTQKFGYKAYSSLFCNDPFSGISISSPINTTNGESASVEIGLTNISPVTGETLTFFPTQNAPCTNIYVVQMNSGSEFVGSINELGSLASCSANQNSITECGLQLSAYTDSLVGTAIVTNGSWPISYFWSNGDVNPITTFDGPGFYGLTVFDANCCTSNFNFYASVPLSACWYTLPDEYDSLYNGLLLGDYIYTITSLIVDTTQLITGTTPTYDLSLSTLNSINIGAGKTYSNFVDFLNEIFVSLGLVNYRAQLSVTNLNNNSLGGNPQYNGFYIIKPATDAFTIHITETNNYDTIYTESGVTDSGGSLNRESVCNGIIITNGQVVE